MTEIRVPTLGESVTEATIGKWFKKPGDPVAVDEPLVELETDKVTIEVPAPAAGTLNDIAANDGETVAVGALLGSIKEGAGAPARPAEAKAAPASAAEQKSKRDVTQNQVGDASSENGEIHGPLPPQQDPRLAEISAIVLLRRRAYPIE